MRIAVIAGLQHSGKTTLARAVCAGRDITYIANNPQSEEMMKDSVRIVDHYPFKSPCARVRQFSYRVDLHENDDVSMIVSEPPGSCVEQSSPMLNPIYATQRDRYSIAPLITVLDGRIPANRAITNRTTEGLRIFRMVEESDVLALTFSDFLSESDRRSAEACIREINDTCEIVFCSPKEGRERIAEILFGDSSYARPLFC